MNWRDAEIPTAIPETSTRAPRAAVRTRHRCLAGRTHSQDQDRVRAASSDPPPDQRPEVVGRTCRKLRRLRVRVVWGGSAASVAKRPTRPASASLHAVAYEIPQLGSDDDTDPDAPSLTRPGFPSSVGRDIARVRGGQEGRRGRRREDRRRGDLVFRRVIGKSLVCAIGGLLLASSAAPAAAPHAVLPGESLWSIAYANNLTTRTVAVYNGVPQNAELAVGATVYVPTVEEGAAALASGAPGVEPPATVGAPSTDGADPAAAPPSTATAPARVGRHPVSLRCTPPRPGGRECLERHARRGLADLRNRHLSRRPSIRVPHLRATGQLYQAFSTAAARRPTRPAPPHRTRYRGRRRNEHALGHRPDRLEVRVVKVHGPNEWWHVDYVGR